MSELQELLAKLPTYSRPGTGEAWSECMQKVVTLLAEGYESRPGGAATRDVQALSVRLEVLEGRLTAEEANEKLYRLFEDYESRLGEERVLGEPGAVSTAPPDDSHLPEGGDALKMLEGLCRSRRDPGCVAALAALRAERAQSQAEMEKAMERVRELEGELNDYIEESGALLAREKRKLGERIAELETQLKAARERAPDAEPDIIDLSKGGPWLGAARRWSYRYAGDSLKWDSQEPVSIPFVELWDLAQTVAEEAVREERKARARETLNIKDRLKLEQKIERLEAQLRERKSADLVPPPPTCPITGREFFMVITDESGVDVPTYGGPYDSYTIPHIEAGETENEKTLRCERYDHDTGRWAEGGYPLGLVVVDDELIPNIESERDTALKSVECLRKIVEEAEATAADAMEQRDTYRAKFEGLRGDLQGIHDAYADHGRSLGEASALLDRYPLDGPAPESGLVWRDAPERCEESGYYRVRHHEGDSRWRRIRYIEAGCEFDFSHVAGPINIPEPREPEEQEGEG